MEKLDEKAYGVIGAGIAPKNGIKIRMDKKENVEKLIADAKKKLGDDYEIVQSKELKHRIKIVNVRLETENFTLEDGKKLNLSAIEKFLKKQNDTLKNDPHAKIIFAYEKAMRSSADEKCVDVVMQVSSTSYKFYMVDGNNVATKWLFCKVFDGIHVKRCMRCLSYGHSKLECKNKVVCIKCSGEHEEKECTQQEVKCVNCMRANSGAGKHQYDVSHKANDYNCPSHKIRVNKIARAIQD